MKLKVDIANDCRSHWSPDNKSCKKWLGSALQCAGHEAPGNISLRFVDECEITELNSRYRGKAASTNVLSFPAALPAAITGQLDDEPLGDIVICPQVVEAEASSQGKALEAHWAHLLVHGCLHLLGYDHEAEEQARNMENLEIRALESLGFENPYLIG